MRIGSATICPPVVLAPMAGITDGAFRPICRELGAGLVFSELVSAQALVRENRRSWEMTRAFPGERPLALQLFGADPRVMARAARALMERPDHPEILDINMGCPVPKVTRSGEGAALMKDPDLAGRVVRAVAEAVHPHPVTVKIRAGWDQGSINAPQLARVLEESGAAAITVHGRTRCQLYRGEASWEVIARVKSAVSIPVIGNGDVTGPRSALDMIRLTGVDGVMIGRGALGNPWIFRQVRSAFLGESLPLPPSAQEIRRVMIRHLKALISLKGEDRGVREMRKHAAWYVKGQPGARRWRGELFRASTEAEMADLIARALPDC